MDAELDRQAAAPEAGQREKIGSPEARPRVVQQRQLRLQFLRDHVGVDQHHAGAVELRLLAQDLFEERNLPVQGDTESASSTGNSNTEVSCAKPRSSIA